MALPSWSVSAPADGTPWLLCCTPPTAPAQATTRAHVLLRRCDMMTDHDTQRRNPAGRGGVRRRALSEYLRHTLARLPVRQATKLCVLVATIDAHVQAKSILWRNAVHAVCGPCTHSPAATAQAAPSGTNVPLHQLQQRRHHVDAVAVGHRRVAGAGGDGHAQVGRKRACARVSMMSVCDCTCKSGACFFVASAVPRTSCVHAGTRCLEVTAASCIRGPSSMCCCVGCARGHGQHVGRIAPTCCWRELDRLVMIPVVRCAVIVCEGGERGGLQAGGCFSLRNDCCVSLF
jgi:hypothetical protein